MENKIDFTKRINCPECGCATEKGFCNNCEIMIVRTCPECGDYVWSYNDPELNYGSEQCGSCRFYQNDLVSWEDIKEDYPEYAISK